MKIILQPEDLIKRCLWDSYVYYILGSEKEAQRLLEENNEFPEFQNKKNENDEVK